MRTRTGYGQLIPSPNELLDCSDNESEEEVTAKPKLEDFLTLFEQKIAEVNITYKQNKSQFEEDMRSFNDTDIQEEEEIIEKSINDGVIPAKKTAEPEQQPSSGVKQIN